MVIWDVDFYFEANTSLIHRKYPKIKTHPFKADVLCSYFLKIVHVGFKKCSFFVTISSNSTNSVENNQEEWF
jgi:hypothetical protein